MRAGIKTGPSSPCAPHVHNVSAHIHTCVICAGDGGMNTAGLTEEEEEERGCETVGARKAEDGGRSAVSRRGTTAVATVPPSVPPSVARRTATGRTAPTRRRRAVAPWRAGPHTAGRQVPSIRLVRPSVRPSGGKCCPAPGKGGGASRLDIYLSTHVRVEPWYISSGIGRRKEKKKKKEEEETKEEEGKNNFSARDLAWLCPSRAELFSFLPMCPGAAIIMLCARSTWVKSSPEFRRFNPSKSSAPPPLPVPHTPPREKNKPEQAKRNQKNKNK